MTSDLLIHSAVQHDERHQKVKVSQQDRREGVGGADGGMLRGRQFLGTQSTYDIMSSLKLQHLNKAFLVLTILKLFKEHLTSLHRRQY